MALTDQDLARAEAFGRLAARRHRGYTACPYEANGSPDDRVLAARFMRAYTGAGGKVSATFDDGDRADGEPKMHTHNGKVKVAIVRNPKETQR